jgi:hypothetical protein
MAGGHGVVYLSVGWSSLPTLLRRSGFGRESWFVRSHLSSAAGERLLRVFGVREIDLDSVGMLPTDPDSTEGPVTRGIAALESTDLNPLVEWFAGTQAGAANASGLLRNVLVREVAGRTVDAFYAQLWARSRGYASTVFVGATPWDRLLLQDRELGYRVVGSVSRALASVAQTAQQLRMSLDRRTPEAGGPEALADLPVTQDGERDWAAGSAATGSVLFVLNISTVFGGLYSYDHVFTDDPGSPLNVHNVVAMATNGGPLNPQGVRQGYPSSGSRRHRLLRATSLSVKALVRFRRTYPMAQVRRLASVCAQAEGQAASLRARFPSARIAILAYDLQIPIGLILALESAGIRTVALNERPLSSVVVSQPIAVSTLLTAGPVFSDAAVHSPSVAVQHAPAVGMWRTDLIREYGKESPEGWNMAAVDGRRRVLVLPYHLESGSRLPTNPIATSAASVRQFLTDVLDLVEDRGDIYVVIRGKNDRWLDDPRCTDIAARIAASPAVEVSHRYDRLNESYRLVAGAELIVAKYTSLVDEALACDIPSIVHDYTANSRDVARPVVRYLPRELWALDSDELRSRVDWALADGGGAFRAYWAPHRAAVFGDLADGEVRARARQAMTDLLQVP